MSVLKTQTFFVFFLLITLSFHNPTQAAPSLSSKNLQRLNLKLKKDLLINSSNFQYKLKEKKIYTKDRTHITIGAYQFKSKSSTINLEKKELLFKNGVELTSPKFTVKCTVLNFQLQSKSWQCHKAELKTKKHHFSGKTIVKNKDEYQINNASFTSCKVCSKHSPDWSLHSNKITIKKNRSFINLPTIKVKNLPLLALPYLSIPVATNRATGLLIPKLAYSKNLGLSYSQTFFIPFNINNDLSINETIYSKKIIKSRFEYRHIFKKNKYASLYFSHLLDKKNKTNYTGLSYTQYLQLKKGWTQRLRLQFISDPLFLQKFYAKNEPVLKNYGATSLESKASLTKNSQNESLLQHFNIEGLSYQNLLNSSLSFKKSPAYSLPNIHYFLLSNKKLSHYFSGSLNVFLDNFNTGHKGFVPATVSSGQREIENDSARGFNPQTDIITTGSRLHLNPKVNFNFQPNNLIKSNLKFSYNQLLYKLKPKSSTETNSDYKKSAHQGTLNINYFIKSNLYKIIPYKNKKYKHSIEPSIEISYTPLKLKNTHAFLNNTKTTENTFNDNYFFNPKGNIQFDYFDNIQKNNRINFKLYTNVIEKYKKQYTHLLDFQVSQAFNVNSSHDYQSESLLTEVNVLVNQLGILSKTAYNHKSKLLNTSNHIYWISDNKNYKIDVNYANTFFTGSKKDNFHDKQENLKLTSLVSNHNWSLSGSIDLFKKLKQARQLQSWNYKMSFQPNNQCWKLSFQQKIELQQDSSFHLNLNLNI